MGQLTKVTHRQYLKINRDYAKAASLAELVYVSDAEPGIIRLKKGRGYMYVYAGKAIRKKDDIKRIRSLAIPPSWTSVWICTRANDISRQQGWTFVNGNNTGIIRCGRYYAMKPSFTG